MGLNMDADEGAEVAASTRFEPATDLIEYEEAPIIKKSHILSSEHREHIVSLNIP